MSLVKHTFFPRSAFDMDFWMRPEDLLGMSTLDIFDPFDELDRTLGRNLMWLDVPEMLKSVTPALPRVPKKYRITVNCKGFNPNSIKTKVSDDKTKLIVTAKEGAPATKGEEDYTLRELRRTYNLPSNVETDKLVSFMTSGGKLVVEIPMKREEKEDEFPRITEEKGGNKAVEMTMSLPRNIDPSKIKVTCKDRDIVVQAEDKTQKEDETSQVYYYRRTTLPENTDLNSLQCTLENNQLCVKAPLNVSLQQSEKSIPIQVSGKQSITQGQGQQQQAQKQQQTQQIPVQRMEQ